MNKANDFIETLAEAAAQAASAYVEIAGVAEDMRNAQKVYFRTRTQAALVEATRWEKYLDELLEQLKIKELSFFPPEPPSPLPPPSAPS